jgi:NitT/TauT family transport system substrate-binding protein
MIRSRFIGFLLVMTVFLAACGGPCDASEATEIRIMTGAGGVGFLPLLIMQKSNLIQKHAEKEGVPNLQVRWVELGGPTVANDSLVSCAIDFAAAGPPAFLISWDKTLKTTYKVKGVAAITSLPMYLNVRGDKLKTLEDFTDTDKIAMTAIEASIPAIALKKYAYEKYGEATRFDKHTVQMTHPDGVSALLNGKIAAHYTSPPFHKRELKDPGIHTIMTTDEVMKGPTTFTMLSARTTFHDRNPKAVAAVLAALEEATRIITNDKQAAAALLSSTSGLKPEELMEVIGDPAVKFTTTPENVMKYAEFMHRINILKNLPASEKDLFFQEIYEVPGN